MCSEEWGDNGELEAQKMALCERVLRNAQGSGGKISTLQRMKEESGGCCLRG